MIKGELGLGHSTMIIIIVALSLKIVAFGASSRIDDLSKCPKKCGNVTIHYPFGIGDNCHYKHHLDGSYYNLTCNYSTSPPSLFYGEGLQVTNISLDGEFRALGYIAYKCYNASGYKTIGIKASTNSVRFPISTTKNSLVGIGCDTYVWFEGSGMSNNTQFQSGCMTVCAEEQEEYMGESGGKCSGIGCCEANIPEGVTDVKITAKSFNNHTFVHAFNPCSVAFIVAKDAMPTFINQLLPKSETFLEKHSFSPMVFNWSIGTNNCSKAQATGESEYICKGNSSCLDSPDWGYRCQCNPGFRGNPYLHDCQDIDECKEGRHQCEKPSFCVNTVGNYTCSCPRGYSRRSGTSNNDPCVHHRRSIAIIITIGVGGSIIVFLVVAFWLYLLHERRQLIKTRGNFFHQNGGHILHARLSRQVVSMANMVKMFTFKEIKKATNNYSENSIIGRGGFGMVYKGTLPNNQVVAIKKSLKVNPTQVEQFINEVIALSQINNKNVVKLLGCCLETEVPLLVYEYIRNGTLHDHLHDEQKVRLLTWDVRLRIAAEVAEVLAYLHTTITVPIIHRDIKSMNVLLDENFVAKVSDFGASKLVPENQDQLTTIVQGTCGYLDPEYMQTGELTEKSDVYSFGVVLVELLTGQKAISYNKPEEERCLAIYFLRKLKENCLFKILDDKVVSDGAIEQLKEVANLARKCLQVKGEDRPTMKQVSRELEDITGIGTHPWSNDGGIRMHEESEYLIGKAFADDKGYSNNAMSDPSSSQSRVVQLEPLNDGR